MKNKIYFKTVLIIAMAFKLNSNVKAQSYFAGVGAGTGNTGLTCVGIGFNSLHTSNSGFGNTAIGSYSLNYNTTGNYNTALGAISLSNNTIGENNTASGARALEFNTTGSNNTANGFYSLYANTTGWNNNAFGRSALQSNTTAWNNNAFGFSALYSNKVGSENSAFGHDALYYNDSASFNSAFGNYALFSNKKGNNNCSFGTYSLGSNINGSANCAFGFQALSSNTNGYGNSGIGDSALFANTTGYVNVAIGRNAFHNNTAGNNNVAIGKSAGSKYASYIKCTFVGATADASATGLNNATAIGFGASVDASNKVRVGNTAVTSIGGQVGWTTLSDLRLKKNIKESKLGLDFILNLHPVTYNYIDENQKVILYTGLIAQEVDAAAKKEGVDFSGVDKNGEYWGIRYGDLTVPLISAVKELNQQNVALKFKNEKLENENANQQLAIGNLQNENLVLKNENEKQQLAIGILQSKIEEMSSCLETLCATNELKSSSNFQIIESSNLFQNNPNPFKENTTIGFYISSTSNKALLKIFSMNGEEIKSFIISKKGKGQIEITGNTLAPGVYPYVLIVDDMTVDTKQMVITR